MPIQRVREGESRIGNKLSNGPRRAQSNEADRDTREEESWDPGSNRVFCDVRQALRAGDMIVSYEGTADRMKKDPRP